MGKRAGNTSAAKITSTRQDQTLVIKQGQAKAEKGDAAGFADDSAVDHVKCIE